MNIFERIINAIIRTVRSPQAGFLFVLLGIIYQTLHNYYFFNAFSAYTMEEENLLLFESWDGSLFISGALMYFLLRAAIPNNSGMVDYEKMRIAESFRKFETAVNLCFHIDKLLVPAFSIINVTNPETGVVTQDWAFNALVVNWLYLTMSIPLSFAVPYFIKIYAGEVIIDKPNEVPVQDATELKSSIINLVAEEQENARNNTEKLLNSNTEELKKNLSTDFGRKLKKNVDKLSEEISKPKRVKLDILNDDGSVNRQYSALMSSNEPPKKPSENVEKPPEKSA